MPRSAMPSATRACGSWNRASRASRARPCAGSRPWRIARPAAASPGVPLIQRSSPARAPSRADRLPGWHGPGKRHGDGQRAARRVAADERDAVAARERIEARGESGEPVLVDRRQRQSEQRPGGLGAHGGEIATGSPRARDGRRSARRILPENARPRRSCRARRRACRRAAPATSAPSSPTPAKHVLATCAAPREVPLDQLEFARRHRALRQPRRARRRGARVEARSSTAFT